MPRIGSNLNPVLKTLEDKIAELVEQREEIQKTIITTMDLAAQADKAIEGFRRAWKLVMDASNSE